LTIHQTIHYLTSEFDRIPLSSPKANFEANILTKPYQSSHDFRTGRCDYSFFAIIIKSANDQAASESIVEAYIFIMGKD